MKVSRFFKWVAVAFVVLLLIFVSITLILRQWLNSADFHHRVEQQASAQLGIPIQLGALSLTVWPVPAIAVDQVEIKTQPHLTVGRVEIRPLWTPLLHRRLEIATVLVRDAVLPQSALTSLAAALEKMHPPSNEPSQFRVIPKRVQLKNITWVNDLNQSHTFDMAADLDDESLPIALNLEVRGGRFKGVKAKLEHKNIPWQLKLSVGGGSVQGQFTWQASSKPGWWQLRGQFDAKDIEVSTLSAPNGTLTGKLEAHTSLHAELRNPGELPDTVHSQTHFVVHDAVIHGVDLIHAVKTLGVSHSGETHLDQLSGEFITQGRTMQLNNLVANSGQLSATGQVAMTPNHNLSGQASVDLKASAGSVGIPLTIGGTLENPTVVINRSMLVGATLGTLVAPGVGTAVGAKLGDKVHRWFSK